MANVLFHSTIRVKVSKSCLPFYNFRAVIESLSESESEGKSPDVKKRLFSDMWFVAACMCMMQSPRKPGLYVVLPNISLGTYS